MKLVGDFMKLAMGSIFISLINRLSLCKESKGFLIGSSQSDCYLSWDTSCNTCPMMATDKFTSRKTDQML